MENCHTAELYLTTGSILSQGNRYRCDESGIVPVANGGSGSGTAKARPNLVVRLSQSREETKGRHIMDFYLVVAGVITSTLVILTCASWIASYRGVQDE